MYLVNGGSVVGPAAWFHFQGEDRSSEAAILEALSLAGVQVSSLEASEAHLPGVLCFSVVNDALLAFLQIVSRNRRVLALSTEPSVLRGGGSWRLVQSGASDVLVWGNGAAVAADIRAKLERWTAIEQLAESGPIRESLIGESRIWRLLVRRIVEAARFTDVPVLLIGESGTGKELLARAVHLLDQRASSQRAKTHDLVTLDCTTIVPELSGSELFGHERGSFTGAIGPREGAFALADGGTLFLDEVGELPMHLQAQLLRAVQEKAYKRVGGNVWQKTDFRLVCATNRDLREAVARGEFRLDLYYRIAGLIIRTPPLRERPEDILPLANHFLKTLSGEEDVSAFSQPVQEYLSNRQYEGNVRDLLQLVQRIAHRHVGPGPITIGDIPEEDRPMGAELPRAWIDNLEKAISQAVSMGARLKEISHVAAKAAILLAVEAEQGNLQRAARRLGVTDRALQLRRAAAAGEKKPT